MNLDCSPGFVTLVWTERSSQADTSLFRLGNCFPTSLSAREAVFSLDVNDCNFKRLVTGDQLIYTNDLTYISSPDSHIAPFTHPVVCVYERPKDWYPLIYDPVFNTYGQGDLVFHIGLMNDDFSGPAQSTSFPLGSFIPITASVAQKTHQPLLLLLEECVASTTPELQPESSIYSIITNKGCLVDSKISRSQFEPRQKSSEIHLSLQAFKFALGEEVFIHCKLVAWDPSLLDNTKKACHYVKDYGWELLDNPAYNNLCDCCESSCKSRRTRSTISGNHGIMQKAVLGPLTITGVTS
ncbi:zona pellucida sperm-binding protein 3-like [Tautogolabrus adspersus]